MCQSVVLLLAVFCHYFCFKEKKEIEDTCFNLCIFLLILLHFECIKSENSFILLHFEMPSLPSSFFFLFHVACVSLWRRAQVEAEHSRQGKLLWEERIAVLLLGCRSTQLWICVGWSFSPFVSFWGRRPVKVLPLQSQSAGADFCCSVFHEWSGWSEKRVKTLFPVCPSEAGGVTSLALRDASSGLLCYQNQTYLFCFKVDFILRVRVLWNSSWDWNYNCLPMDRQSRCCS